MRLLNYSCILLLFLSSCSTTKSTGSNTSETSAKPVIDNTQWKAISLYNAETGKTQTFDTPYKIDFKDNQVNIKLEVNHCWTGYKVTENEVVVQDAMACTEACCDSETGGTVSNFFHGKIAYNIQGDILTLNKKNILKLVRDK